MGDLMSIVVFGLLFQEHLARPRNDVRAIVFTLAVIVYIAYLAVR